MSDMYTDIERSIERTLVAAILAKSFNYPVFNNMVSKKDIHNQNAGLSIMKTSDVFNPANGGGAKAVIRTPVLNNLNQVSSFNVEDWPDPFDLLYQFTTIAVSLQDARNLDQLIRDTLRPQKILKLWDSAANGGQGAFTAENYANYSYAGYINRDVPENSTYWRVTNIRFEVFNYQHIVTTEPAITAIDFAFDVQQGIPQQNQVQAPNSAAIQEVPPTLMSLAHAVYPAGVKDGNNTIFFLPDIPRGLVLLYLNGGLVMAVDGQGQTNWTLAGNMLTTVGFRVKATDDLAVVY